MGSGRWLSFSLTKWLIFSFAIGRKQGERMDIITDQNTLRQISKPVKEVKTKKQFSDIYSFLPKEISDICRTLLESIPENGIGLAAPQLGIFKRVFLATLGNKLHLIVNPEMTWRSPDEVPSEEGCLSIPGVARCVLRYNQIRVDAYLVLSITSPDKFDITDTSLTLRGFDSCVFQHEFDHLEGTLFIDLPETKTKTERASKKRTKRKQKIVGNRLKEKQDSHVKHKQEPKHKQRNKSKKQRFQEKKQARKERSRLKRRVQVQEQFKLEQAEVLDVKESNSLPTQTLR